MSFWELINKMIEHFLYPVNITYRVMVLAESQEDAETVAEDKLTDIQGDLFPEFFVESEVIKFSGSDSLYADALPVSRDHINTEQKSCRHFTLDYIKKEKEKEKKRQEILSKLTEEEKEILGIQ